MQWRTRLFKRHRRYDDLAVSIREHIAERADELIESGMPQTEAEQAARREFGNVALIEQRSREAWQWLTLESILFDVRFAVRQLRKAPGFALTAVLTLALGVGAATAMFSVLDAALLRPLPFAHQDRIVAVNTYSQSGYTQPFSYPDYVDTRQQMSTLAALSGYMPGNTTLQAGAGQPVVVRQIQTGDAFFDVFGVRTLLGRGFLSGEEQPGRNQVAVLSYAVWQEYFDGDRGVIGRAAHINGRPMTIVGVMPPGSAFGAPQHLHAVPDAGAVEIEPWVALAARYRPAEGRYDARAGCRATNADSAEPG